MGWGNIHLKTHLMIGSRWGLLARFPLGLHSAGSAVCGLSSLTTSGQSDFLHGTWLSPEGMSQGNRQKLLGLFWLSPVLHFVSYKQFTKACSDSRRGDIDPHLSQRQIKKNLQTGIKNHHTWQKAGGLL